METRARRRKQLFDAAGRTRIHVEFARCHPEVVRELGHGIYGIVSLLPNGHALKCVLHLDQQHKIETEILCLARLTKASIHIAPRLYSTWICPRQTTRRTGEQFVDLMEVYRCFSEYYCYIEMENMVDAKTLYEMPPEACTLRVVKTLFYKICVMQYEYEIFHNDLHAKNVLYQTHPDGTVSDVFIIDFGMAGIRQREATDIEKALQSVHAVRNKPVTEFSKLDAIAHEIKRWFEKNLPDRHRLLLAYCDIN